MAFTERPVVFNDRPEKNRVVALECGVLAKFVRSFYGFDFIGDRNCRFIPPLPASEKWRDEKIVPPYDGSGLLGLRSGAHSDESALDSGRGFSVIGNRVSEIIKRVFLVEFKLKPAGIEDVNIRPFKVSERTFSDPNGLSCGLRHTLGGLPQGEGERGNKCRGDSGNSIAIFVSEKTGASENERGVIDSREREFWRVFFAGLSIGLLLIGIAFLKGRR